MRLQPLAELVQTPGSNGARFELQGSEPDLRMVSQHPSDQVRVEASGPGQPWEQDVFLDAEMNRPLLAPECGELVAGIGRLRVTRPAQALGDDKRPVVVAGELL